MAIRVAIVGYGLSGSVFHTPFFQVHHKFEIAAIVSSRPELVAKKCPGLRIEQDAEEIFRDSGVELVVLTSPNTTHYPLAKRALEAGKDVLVEKPFTPRYQEALELARLAREKGRIVSVYQNRRWDADFLTLKKVIDSGVLGRIYHFESHFNRFRPEVPDRWREKDLPGSGLLYDLGSHLLDQSLQLFGTPDWILGDVAEQRQHSEVDDYFHLLLGYGRMRGVLHCSCLVAGRIPRFAVHGDGGSFIKYGLDPQEERLRAGALPSDSLGREEPGSFGILTTPVGEKVIPGETGNYMAYFDGLARAIETRTPPPVTAEQGATVIRGLEMVKESPLQKLYWYDGV